MVRASVLLGVDQAGERVAVALDADRDEFVRLPALPAGRGWELLALSPDGTQLLYLDRHGTSSLGGLFLHTLATGQRQVFDASADGRTVLAALSPDGRGIATLSLPHDPSQPHDPDAGLAAVGIIDTTTGRQRRLWARPGTWARGSTVSWSPDGQLIAVNYMTLDEADATVVLDPTGHEVGHYDDVVISTSPNGAWLGPRELICGHDHPDGWNLTALNLVDGTHRVLGPRGAMPIGRIGDRLIASPTSSVSGPIRVNTTDLGGTDPQPFLTIHTTGGIEPFDTMLSA